MGYLILLRTKTKVAKSKDDVDDGNDDAVINRTKQTRTGTSKNIAQTTTRTNTDTRPRYWVVCYTPNHHNHVKCSPLAEYMDRNAHHAAPATGTVKLLTIRPRNRRPNSIQASRK
ncbi:uncharacterized protein RAG0_15603 [Rhynchosporium agropyri]|uniref:Uncharacterized protein n=1 Tax=Rhynchosporium agropyri TaxID=914238 RepID=A0A1E1LLV9_9HELO|nr:uncharacterized protein RAG0_15603 [Rhynchosporium agropyri]